MPSYVRKDLLTILIILIVGFSLFSIAYLNSRPVQAIGQNSGYPYPYPEPTGMPNPYPTPTEVPNPYPEPTPTPNPYPGPLGSIEVEIWDDLNKDGIHDENEPLIDDIEVNLIDTINKETLIGTTTEGGVATLFYTPGTYQFQVILPNNRYYSPELFDYVDAYEFTLRDEGSNDGIDSDVGRFRGRSPQFTIAEDEIVTDIDAGLLIDKGTIEIEIWNDLNEDGLHDSDEPLLNGITVNLIHRGTKEIFTSTTSENGLAIISYAAGN